MAVLKKGDFTPPVRKKETIEVPELNGEVIAQQITLQQYLEMIRYGMSHDDTAPIGHILADCILGADDLPLMDEAEWNVWSTANLGAAFRLYDKVRNLSGLDNEVSAKNA